MGRLRKIFSFLNSERDSPTVSPQALSALQKQEKVIDDAIQFLLSRLQMIRRSLFRLRRPLLSFVFSCFLSSFYFAFSQCQSCPLACSIQVVAASAMRLASLSNSGSEAAFDSEIFSGLNQKTATVMIILDLLMQSQL